MLTQFRLFRLDSTDGSSEVLNRFLREHRVTQLERQFVAGGPESFYSVLLASIGVAVGTTTPPTCARPIGTTTPPTTAITIWVFAVCLLELPLRKEPAFSRHPVDAESDVPAPLW